MDKRGQILEVAEKLFAEHGFEGTSVRALAKEAHINIAMVSYYFGSKEKLFESLVEFRTGYLHGKLQELSRDSSIDPFTKVGMAIEYYIDRIFSSRSFHKIIHRELMLPKRAELHSNIADILLRNATEIKKMIKEGQKKGIFRTVDADLVMVSVIGTINQCTMSKVYVTKLLKLDSNGMFSDRHKKRLKKYLKDLIRSYLLKTHADD
jgi:AcrR family transcriptional regulator